MLNVGLTCQANDLTGLYPCNSNVAHATPFKEANLHSSLLFAQPVQVTASIWSLIEKKNLLMF